MLRSCFAPLTLAVALLAGCESRVSLGQRCGADRDCVAPLSCRLGLCRVGCEDDLDCAGGAHCVRVAMGTGACTLASEERCTESVCPSPLVCRDDRCQAQCLRDEDCLASQRCDGTVCVARDSTAPDGGALDARPAERCLRVCVAGEECSPGVPCDTRSDGVTVEGITYGSCPEIAEPAGCPTPR